MKKRIVLVIGLAVLTGVAVIAFLFIRQLRSAPIPLGAPSGELAFMSDSNGSWDIFVMDSDGDVRNLTPDGDVPDYFPSWSFEGDFINFLTVRTGELGPGQVRPDGSGYRTLSITEAVMALFLEGRLDWDPAWMPGGGRMLWTSVRDLNLEIYAAGSDGQDRARLTDHGARDWYMGWSPDGTRIVFNSNRAGNEDIYAMDANGENLVRLTDHEANDMYPVWSMDGERILFVSERERGLEETLDLYIMNADGSEQRPFTHDELFLGDPTYSSDGRQLVYISNEDGNWNLYVMNADGSDVRRLTDGNANNLYPVWRPVPAEAPEGTGAQ